MPASYALPVRPLVGLIALLLLLPLTAGTLVAGASPAAAESVRHRDARHDVRQTRDGRPGSTAAPRRAEPDVTQVKVGHSDRRLRVQVRVRQLTETRNHAALVQIVTPGFTAGLYVTRLPRRDLTSVVLVRGAGRVVDCPGLVYRMWFPKGIVNVVIPRSCLDDPRWVRVGFALSWTTTRRSLTDDGLSPRLGGSATLTRRLRAG